jgi:hypothetical protein
MNERDLTEKMEVVQETQDNESFFSLTLTGSFFLHSLFLSFLKVHFFPDLSVCVCACAKERYK